MSVRHTRHSTLLLEPDDAVGKHSREATPPPPSPGRMGLLPRSMNNNLGTLAVVLLGATALAYMGGFLEPHTASRTVQLEQLEVALQQQKTLVEECDMRRDEEIRSIPEKCAQQRAALVSKGDTDVSGSLQKCVTKYKDALSEKDNVRQSYDELKAHIEKREKSCRVVANSLEGAVQTKDEAVGRIKTLEEKDRTSQAIIDNLRDAVLKSSYHKHKSWKENQNERATAHSKLSIYVYDMPRFNVDFYNAHLSEYAKKCRNQIGEREMHQRFLDSPNRVMDGELADLYYVPVYAGCYRTVVGTELQTDAYSATYKFITDAMDTIKKNHPFWERSQGRDHVWLFLYDYGVCLEYARPNARQRKLPAGLENSILVQYLGDITPGMECFSTWKDVVIPAFVNNPQILAVRGGESIDPENRHTFAYFRGSIKWKLSKWHTKEMNYSNGVREIINNTYFNDELFSLHQGSSPDYIKEMTSSIFCLAPLGYALWNFRLFESIIMGCIPVIIADNIELPFEKDIDYRQFTVKILETQVHHLKDILLSIPKADIVKKQTGLRNVWRKFAYPSPSEEGDAFSGILDQLAAHADRPFQPAAKTYWL